MDNVVFVAVKKSPHGGAMVGYFATEADVPEGWTLADQPRNDITDVMKASRCTKEQALKMMNSHWQ